MQKPIGGRGKKAPYETTHVRIPKPLIAEVEALKKKFFGMDQEEAINSLTSIEDATVLAKSILIQKKSARVSLEKLLTALYQSEVKL